MMTVNSDSYLFDLCYVMRVGFTPAIHYTKKECKGVHFKDS